MSQNPFDRFTPEAKKALQIAENESKNAEGLSAGICYGSRRGRII